jgi:hypothetical protein
MIELRVECPQAVRPANPHMAHRRIQDQQILELLRIVHHQANRIRGDAHPPQHTIVAPDEDIRLKHALGLDRHPIDIDRERRGYRPPASRRIMPGLSFAAASGT